MNNTIIKTIGKYALLLTVFYVIESASGYVARYLTKDIENYQTSSILMSLPMILSYLLNVVTAVIISFDKTKLEITGKYSVLLAIFYRPIGVVLFLIYLINKGLERSSTHNIGS